MNRRQLLSLAVLPFVPKTLNATDTPKPTQLLYISGYGKYEICKVTGKRGLVFKVNEANRKAESELFRLLCKIFPRNAHGDLRVDYIKLDNEAIMKDHNVLAAFFVCYMIETKTLSMLTYKPGIAYLSRYNKNGIRIN